MCSGGVSGCGVGIGVIPIAARCCTEMLLPVPIFGGSVQEWLPAGIAVNRDPTRAPSLLHVQARAPSRHFESTPGPADVVVGKALNQFNDNQDIH